MNSTVSGSGFTFSKDSVGGTWSWTVQASNIQGCGQLFQVADVLTPYGKFTEAQIPLPGDVVLEMASSISDVQAQLAPAIVLISGTPVTYSATVTEGDPSLTIAVVPFTNGGAFGSFLTASATPDAQWLTANPPSIVGIQKNQRAQINAGLIPSIMLATSSPYSGHINLQDANSPSSPVVLTMNVTVLPRPQIQVAPTTVTLSYSLFSGITSGAQQSIVTNTGPAGSVLNYTAAKIQNQSPWLAFTPPSDGPIASGGTSPITFSIVSGGLPALPGTYSEVVAVASKNASNSPQNITVQLVVTP